MSKSSKELPFTLYAEDCLTGVPRWVKAGLPTLACLDVPYNIGQNYSDYVDKKTQKAYLNYLAPRIAETVNSLHEHGSLWIAINDANVSELDIYCKNELGLYPRKRVIWCMTFGQNNPRNFTAAHITWLYYSRHRTRYIFNHDDPAVRVPSARQLVYGDKRANPKGRLPDDFWILRPQELPSAFEPHMSTWYFPRLCGTFKDKIAESPNQLPVRMLERIVRFCSNPGDTVIDTFGGTMSLGEAAINTGRKFIGFDVSKGVVKAATVRLHAAMKRKQNVAAGQQLDLFPDEAKPAKRKK